MTGKGGSQSVRRSHWMVSTAAVGAVLIGAPAGAVTAEPASLGQGAAVSVGHHRAGGRLAGPVRQCGNTGQARDISIVSYQYVDCAMARSVAASYASGHRLPPIAPGAAVRWKCSKRGSSYARSAFGAKLPGGHVECVGYRGGEFIRFKPLGSSASTTGGPPQGVSVWEGGGSWRYIQRRGSRLRIAWVGGQEYGYEQGTITGDRARLRTDYGVQTTQFQRTGDLMQSRTKSNGSWSEWYSSHRTTAKKAQLKRLFNKADWSRP